MEKKALNIVVEKDGLQFYANIKDFTMSMGIKGCPMGRGLSVESAVKDLVRRVEIESKVTIVPTIFHGHAFDPEADANQGGEDSCPAGAEDDYNRGF
jgi:hypothetical protein